MKHFVTKLINASIIGTFITANRYHSALWATATLNPRTATAEGDLGTSVCLLSQTVLTLDKITLWT